MRRKISDDDVQLRKQSVVQSATEVFLRYGYARTTMAELAAAARLSRPSLYELYPGKDELFAAVIRRLNDETLQEFRKASPKLRTVRSKLQRFCGEWATHGLRLMEKHPDAKDLFNLELPVVREMYEDFIKFLVDLISAEPHATRVPVAKLARNLVFSLRGLREAAQSIPEMEDLVHLQVDVFLAMLAPRD